MSNIGDCVFVLFIVQACTLLKQVWAAQCEASRRGRSPQLARDASETAYYLSHLLAPPEAIALLRWAIQEETNPVESVLLSAALGMQLHRIQNSDALNHLRKV